jgi:MFS superfamily sulfate permease-like transporter
MFELDAEVLGDHCALGQDCSVSEDRFARSPKCLFPDRTVSGASVSISTGLMNIFSAVIGGVPMCHGADGMAGHVRFGARTGGALIILGALPVLLALFFSGSVQTIFGLIPREVLGVILFLTGAQLALGSCDFSENKDERFVTIVTTGLSMWNIGLAFVIGMSVFHLLKRGCMRLCDAKIR